MTHFRSPSDRLQAVLANLTMARDAMDSKRKAILLDGRDLADQHHHAQLLATAEAYRQCISLIHAEFDITPNTEAKP